MHLFTRAISRTPGSDFMKGLTTAELGEPDLILALEQHDNYITVLQEAGLQVDLLSPLEGFPDATFVEDTAIVAESVAVITHPGAPSRVGETYTVAEALAEYKEVVRMSNPGATLDGGDVLRIDNVYFVGISDRTNYRGLEELSYILSKYGPYNFVPVEVSGGLHLKSSVTQIGENTVLITEDLSGHPAFETYSKVIVPGGEEYAANALFINETLLMADGFPQTLDLCQRIGCNVRVMNMSEFRKMDGALTCLSLRF